MTRRDPDRSSCEGYILVAVLGVMLTLAGFIAAGSLLVRSTLDTAKVDNAYAKTEGLARGGLELTAYQLFMLKAVPSRVDRHRIRLNGGTIASLVVDEASKVDLNGSDPKLLTAVFEGAGLDTRTAADLLAYIIDMRGAGRGAPTPGLPSVNAMPPTTQTNPKSISRGFLSVDQLRDFRDLTRSDWRALQSRLTVFNPDGRINILSADRNILTAIPGLSSADIEVILERRSTMSKGDVESLMSRHAESKPFLKAAYGPAFTVQVEAISTSGLKKTIHAVLAASKLPDDPFYVLDWWE